MIPAKRLAASTIIPPQLYVKREADRQVIRNIESMGRPAYVLVSRQMGKTNLLIQTKRELEKENQIFAYIDLSNKLPTPRDCFRNIVESLLNTNPRLPSDVKSAIFAARDATPLLPSKEFEAEMLHALNAVSGKIIIILDEIDALIDTDYSDEIFAQIRSVYFNRVNYPVFERLTFLLSGVAEPSSLIKDRTKSPFNIGEKIYINDFTFKEFEEFLAKSELGITDSAKDRVYDWIAGHPRMTWDVCSALEDCQLAGQGISAETVDRVVQDLYLNRFDLPPIDHIRDLVRSDKAILRAIKQIHHDDKLQLSDLLRKKLYLSGIIRSDSSGEELKLKNKVIAASLTSQWLESIETFSLALVFMGDEQKQLRNYKVAIKHYSECLQRDDVTDPNVRNTIEASIGHCYQQLNEWDTALEHFGKCSFDRVNSVDGYYNVAINTGVCLFAKGDVEKASTLFDSMIRQAKRGVFKWKACVNYAGTLIRIGKTDADSKAAELYNVILTETEEFEDVLQESKDLKAISLYNLGEIAVRTGDVTDARAYFDKAVRASGREFQPYLYLRMAETELDARQRAPYLKQAVDIIMGNRLELGAGSAKSQLLTQMVFDADTLRKLLLTLLQGAEGDYYSRLSVYARTHFLKQARNGLDVVLWIVQAPIEGFEDIEAIPIIERALGEQTSDSSDSKRSQMTAYRYLSKLKRWSKRPFFNDLKAFIAIFRENKNFGQPITENDLIDFVYAIMYLRDRKEPSGALQIAEIIVSYFDASAETVKPEFVAVYFLMAQAHEAKGNNNDAKVCAGRALDLLKVRDPNKTSGVLAAQQIEQIRLECQSMISRLSLFAKPPSLDAFSESLRSRRVGRNEQCPCGSGKKYKYCCGK